MPWSSHQHRGPQTMCVQPAHIMIAFTWDREPAAMALCTHIWQSSLDLPFLPTGGSRVGVWACALVLYMPRTCSRRAPERRMADVLVAVKPAVFSDAAGRDWCLRGGARGFRTPRRRSCAPSSALLCASIPKWRFSHHCGHLAAAGAALTFPRGGSTAPAPCAAGAPCPSPEALADIPSSSSLSMNSEGSSAGERATSSSPGKPSGRSRGMSSGSLSSPMVGGSPRGPSGGEPSGSDGGGEAMGTSAEPPTKLRCAGERVDPPPAAGAESSGGSRARLPVPRVRPILRESGSDYCCELHRQPQLGRRGPAQGVSPPVSEFARMPPRVRSDESVSTTAKTYFRSHAQQWRSRCCVILREANRRCSR